MTDEPTTRLSGYRKLFAFGLIVACATVLQAIGQLGEAYSALVVGLYLTFVGGNVGEYFARAKQAVRVLPSAAVRGGFVGEATSPRNITPAMMKAIQSGMSADDIEALVRDVAGQR